jgi:hypothetical protein
MNFPTGDTTFNNTWKRIKLHYLTAAAGATLALAGAIAIGAWQSGSSSEVSGPSQAARDTYSTPRQAEKPQVVYYLVASQAEADGAAFLDQWEPARRVHILMAASEAEEAAAFEVIRDALADATGLSLAVVDLRGQ